MDYRIERNERTRGYKCNFTHNGKRYYASLCAVPPAEITECMIFRKGHWTDLYCKRYIPVTPEQLAACIDEFVKGV